MLIRERPLVRVVSIDLACSQRSQGHLLTLSWSLPSLPLRLLSPCRSKQRASTLAPHFFVLDMTALLTTILHDCTARSEVKKYKDSQENYRKLQGFLRNPDRYFNLGGYPLVCFTAIYCHILP